MNIDWDNLGFEIRPAEKMFVCHHKNGQWDSGTITDYGAIPMYPSAVVLNYGQAIFEGMKAYRTADDRIAMFRPYENAKRMRKGCRRLCMPELEERVFVSAIEDLLRQNQAFVPPFGKGELYIRPLMFGSGQMLGVNPATEYTFIIFMSPVGPYFKGGFKGIHIEIRDDFHRSARHGTGGIKAVGNYAASLLPRKLSKEAGYDEVLYLDAQVSTYIDEVGSANFFMLKDGVVSTPRLAGSILPGITRETILHLAGKTFGLKTLQRDIRYEETFLADELFCTGTAAVITPILSITYQGTRHTLGDGKPGPMTRRLYDELRGIQLGEKADDSEFLHVVKM